MRAVRRGARARARRASTTTSSPSAATASSPCSSSAGPGRPGWCSPPATCSGTARPRGWPPSPACGRTPCRPTARPDPLVDARPRDEARRGAAVAPGPGRGPAAHPAPGRPAVPRRLRLRAEHGRLHRPGRRSTSTGRSTPTGCAPPGRRCCERHRNLRAGFRYLRSGRPVASSAAPAALPWREVDLRGPAPTSRRRGRAACAAGAAAASTRPSRRCCALVLVRTGDGSTGCCSPTSTCCSTAGRCAPLLRRELVRAVRPRRAPARCPPRRPYRDYLAWLAGRTGEAARAAWREALAGLDEPTRLVPADPARDPIDARRRHDRAPDEGADRAARRRWPARAG